MIAFPRNWPQVREADFVKFLETCDDYRRDSYVGVSQYYFVHNKQVFAYVTGDGTTETILVRPDLWKCNDEPESIPLPRLVRALEELIPSHKCGLYLEHNQHKDVYESAEDWINNHELFRWINDESKQRAISTDSIWTLQWYPETPISFHAIAAPSLFELLRYFTIKCS